MRPTLKKGLEQEASVRSSGVSRDSSSCLVCLSDETCPFLTTEERKRGRRNYRKCPRCGLIFIAPEHRLGPGEEKARYDLHQNDPQDPGYVRFLSRLAVPLAERLKPASTGLDFGCGPGPALGKLLESRGHTVHNYDPFYFPDPSAFERRYDFIVCTEVLEHLFSPREVFMQFDSLLAGKGAVLGLMTGMLECESDFADWWYRQDPTHVAFYRRTTFEWIAAWRNWNLEFPAANVVVYTV